MNIERIDGYVDSRFSKKVLYQHGCFLVDEESYEVEIISDKEAIVHGKDQNKFQFIIDEFLYYSPHIYIFYDEYNHIIKKYPAVHIFDVSLKDIQPSQFYVDKDKVKAIQTFMKNPDDIIIQVMKYHDRYVSLDGHTRLYYANMIKLKKVKAMITTSDDYIYDFVEEAIKRGITSPKDLILLNHEDYEKKWYGFCDDYFHCR